MGACCVSSSASDSSIQRFLNKEEEIADKVFRFSVHGSTHAKNELWKELQLIEDDHFLKKHAYSTLQSKVVICDGTDNPNFSVTAMTN